MTSPNTSSSLSAANNNADYLLRRCWRIQDCHSCLHTSDPCSWCAVSSTCIPNETPVGILGPIWNPAVCPISDERWELRAKGLGCKVSTLTFLSVLVTILATITLACWIWAAVSIWAWSRRRWRKDRLGFQTVWEVVAQRLKRQWTGHRHGKTGDEANNEAQGEQTRLLA